METATSKTKKALIKALFLFYVLAMPSGAIQQLLSDALQFFRVKHLLLHGGKLVL